MIVISHLYYPHQPFGAIQELMRVPEVTLRSVGMAAITTTITAAEFWYGVVLQAAFIVIWLRITIAKDCNAIVRDRPIIILIFLPIMLCCSAQKSYLLCSKLC